MNGPYGTCHLLTGGGRLGILDPSLKKKKIQPPFCDAGKVPTPLRPAFRYWGHCLPILSKVVEDAKMTYKIVMYSVGYGGTPPENF